MRDAKGVIRTMEVRKFSILTKVERETEEIAMKVIRCQRVKLNFMTVLLLNRSFLVITFFNVLKSFDSIFVPIFPCLAFNF